MKKYLFTIISCPILVALAIFFKFALLGYSFMSYTLLGIAAIILAFTALDALAGKYPRFTKITKTVLTYALIIGLIVFAATEVVLVDSSLRAEGQESDCLVVLGAGVNGTVPSASLHWRLEAARDYLVKYPDAMCIVSGGQGAGEEITEAECMREWLTANGIAPERIIKEERSTSTDENIRFSFSIADEMGFDTLTVATSDFHVCRAYLIAAANGRETDMLAAKTRYPVLKVTYYIREFVGIWYYKIFGMI